MTASYAPSTGNFIETQRDDTSHCPAPLITVRICMFVFVVRYVSRHSVNVSFVLLSTFLALCLASSDSHRWRDQKSGNTHSHTLAFAH